MTDDQWWEKADSMATRYPDIDLPAAFEEIVNCYTQGRLIDRDRFSAELVAEVLVLVRHVARTELERDGEIAVQTKEMPTLAVVEMAPPKQVEVPAAERKGCNFFAKK